MNGFQGVGLFCPYDGRNRTIRVTHAGLEVPDLFEVKRQHDCPTIALLGFRCVVLRRFSLNSHLYGMQAIRLYG